MAINTHIKIKKITKVSLNSKSKIEIEKLWFDRHLINIIDP